MNQLAIVYLTHNHSETVEDVLKQCLDLYKQNEIDVYYYDSSDNSVTQNICEKYRDVYGYHNLYYCRAEKGYTFDEKLLDIFSGRFKFEKKYKYIWPIKDRDCFQGELLHEVQRLLQGNYGIIYLGITRRDIYPDYIKENTVLYDNIKEFYMNWGWQSASLSVTIFNSECLDRIDWNRYVYETKWNRMNGFTHYVVLFYLIYKNQNLKIPVIGGKYYEDGVYSSSKSSSMWRNERFNIWINKWGVANKVLPKAYEEYKEYVVKSNTVLSNIIGNQTDLVGYYLEGSFNGIVFSEVMEMWEFSTSIPFSDAQMISEGNFSGAALKVISRINQEVNAGMNELAVLEYNNNMWISNYSKYSDIYEEIGNCLKYLQYVTNN